MTAANKIAILELWKERISFIIATHSSQPTSDIKILSDLCELAALEIKRNSNPKNDPVREKLEKFAQNISG